MLISPFIAQVYLPPFDECGVHFIKQILGRDKYSIKRTDLRTVKVPIFDELSAKKIMAQVVKQPHIMKYLPDPSRKVAPINREFLFNVSNFKTKLVS
jgi:hypothetical protein